MCVSCFCFGFSPRKTAVCFLLVFWILAKTELRDEGEMTGRVRYSIIFSNSSENPANRADIFLSLEFDSFFKARKFVSARHF